MPYWPVARADLLKRALAPGNGRYAVAQLNLIRRIQPAALFAVVSGVAVIASAYGPIRPGTDILKWCAFEAMLTLISMAMVRFCTPDAIVQHTRRWFVLFLLLCVVHSASWAYLAWVYMLTPTPATMNLVLAVCVAVNAGALVLCSPVWLYELCILLIMGVPIVVRLASSPVLYEHILGLASLVYICCMGVFSFFASRAVQASISVHFVNQDLVEKLNLQTQRAEQANLAKTRFMAAAGHDLRQPLHALGLMARTLEETPLDPAQQRVLKRLSATVEATQDMVGSLLDFAHIDTGVVKPQLQAVSVNTIFQNMAQEFAAHASKQHVRMRVHVRSSPLWVQADPVLLTRIVRNLLSNAYQYTEHGGVLLAARLRGQQVVLEVWDTGMGIAPDEQEAIFRECYQINNPERDRRKGIGMGLAIVQSLAQTMGANVQLKSVVSKGSVFRVSLPRVQAGVPPDDTPAVHAMPAQLQGVRLLLVDDDPAVTEAMFELLSTWGMACLTCQDVAAASEAIHWFKPDVIMTDYRLKGAQNGLEGVALLRGALQHPVKAVIVTGDTAPDIVQAALAANVLLIHKPVHAQRLLDTLVGLISSTSPCAGSTKKAPAPNTP